MKQPCTRKENALRIIEKQKGVIRTAQAMRLGIYPEILYRLRDEGEIEQLARGVYRLAKHDLLNAPDVSIVAAKIPEGVICLISALSFHNLTTEIPHEVFVALGRSKWYPTLSYPPVRVFRYSNATLIEGIEHHVIDGVDVKMYSVPRTVVDCFKFRNKIGISIAIDALKESIRERKTTRKEILRYAELLRMKRVIMPYIEALS